MKRDLIDLHAVVAGLSAKLALNIISKDQFEDECLVALNRFLAKHGPKWWEFWR